MNNEEILWETRPGTPLYAILEQRESDRAKIKALKTALENIECSNCGHLLKFHVNEEYGCDCERSADTGGPCGCVDASISELEAIKALKLAGGE